MRLRRFFFFGSALATASGVIALVSSLSFGCASIAGLGEDFTFSDDAAAKDGATDGAADGATDGRADGRVDGAANVCSAIQTTNATTAMNNENGDKLPLTCETCLAQKCCTVVTDCAGSGQCKQAMSCIFSCQERGSTQERQACASQCQFASSFDTVSACASTNCSSCGPL